MDYYDDNCKNNFYFNYELSDSLKKGQLDNNDLEIIKKIETRKEKERVSKFKNFSYQLANFIS